VGGCGIELTIRLMASLATLIILGATLFAATNIDDILFCLASSPILNFGLVISSSASV